MVKYTDTQVTFSEVPDEITLCINISGCPNHCEGCHSAYLAEDIGDELTANEVLRLIDLNPGITCIAFMGGDQDPDYINFLASVIKEGENLPKVAWYSGRQELSPKIKPIYFDYIKLGPYIPANGPLNNPNTNQIMYKVQKFYNSNAFGSPAIVLDDITHKFWNK